MKIESVRKVDAHVQTSLSVLCLYCCCFIVCHIVSSHTDAFYIKQTHRTWTNKSKCCKLYMTLNKPCSVLI